VFELARHRLNQGLPLRVIGRSAQRLEPFLSKGAESVQMRGIRKKAESVSLSAEFFTLAFRARIPVKHPPSADKSERNRIRFESLAEKRFLNRQVGIGY
jgi:hypothetical protein